jgi:hypothetical protein
MRGQEGEPAAVSRDEQVETGGPSGLAAGTCRVGAGFELLWGKRQLGNGEVGDVGAEGEATGDEAGSEYLPFPLIDARTTVSILTYGRG